MIERPLVREVSFEGNREVKTDELREKAAVRVGALYNPRDLPLGVDAIRQKYEEEGFADFTISPRTEHTPEGVRVVFQIDEGRKTIDRILVERLAALAPQIDSRQTTLRSFEFAFRWDAKDFTVRIRCWVEISTRACVILHDGIPVFVATGDRVFLYNALDGPNLWQGDWEVRIREWPAGKFRYEFGVFSPGSPMAGVEMDLRPLTGQAVSRRSVRMVGDQRFVLAGSTQDGDRLEAWIDLAQPVPYSRLLAAFSKGGALELERLTANQAIPPVAFQLPPFHEEGVALSSARSLSSMEAVVQAMRVSPYTDILLRAGMRDPEQRATVESNLGRPVDWSAVASRDASTGQALKRVIERHLQRLP